MSRKPFLLSLFAFLCIGFPYSINGADLLGSPAWTSTGTVSSLAAVGDINGDGFDDILKGDSNFGPSGAVFLYLGSFTGPSLTPFWTGLGTQAGEDLGASVALAGDVNGDGYSDIIAGAPGYGDLNEGRVVVFLGSISGPSLTPSWVFSGSPGIGSLGFAVAGAGDVNGDGYSDFLASAPRASNGETEEGRVLLFLGSPSGLPSTPSWTVEANRPQARFGWSIAGLKDVNGDGFDDVAVASTWFENLVHGRVFVYYGSATGPSTVPSWSTGEPGDYFAPEFGHSISAAGDVNGDGFGDMIVGAPYHSHGQHEEGLAFLYLGGSGGFTTASSWLGESNVPQARLGYQVAGSGDTDGDGHDDIIAGFGNFMGLGRAFVYRGLPSGLEMFPVFCPAGQQGSYFGFNVSAAGDVNDDGLADILVSSPVTPATYLYFGRPVQPIFIDGFDNGSASAWSAHVP